MFKILLANDTTRSQHYGCDLVVTELVRLLREVGLEVVRAIPVGVDWRRKLTSMPARDEVSAIVVNGEGSIHQSATRSRARFLPQLASYAEDIGVPAFLVNSTIFDVESETLSDISRFDRCFVRDQASQELLARSSIKSTVVPDLSISSGLPVSEVRSGVLVTDSVRRDQREFLRRYAQKNNIDYLPMGRVHYEDGAVPPSLDRYVHAIASSAFVVTGRYHVVCLCLATRTPFVAIESNSPKISFICSDILGSRRRVWSRDQVEYSNFDGYTTWNESEQSRLALLRVRARLEAELMAGRIRDRISTRGHK